MTEQENVTMGCFGPDRQKPVVRHFEIKQNIEPQANRKTLRMEVEIETEIDDDVMDIHVEKLRERARQFKDERGSRTRYWDPVGFYRGRVADAINGDSSAALAGLLAAIFGLRFDDEMMVWTYD